MTTLEEAIQQLSLASDLPNADLLDSFARRYPQYATALTEHAVFLALDALTPDAPDEDPIATSSSELVSRAMSRLQNSLFALERHGTIEDDVEESDDSTIVDPFAGMDHRAMRALAKGLEIDTSLLIKLRDRHIEASTIPHWFQQKIADERQVPLACVGRYLELESRVALHGEYKSTTKPAVRAKQSFADAVRGSRLTPEQQSRLLR